MTLQRRLERIILDLEDLKEECRFTAEIMRLGQVINLLRDLHLSEGYK